MVTRLETYIGNLEEKRKDAFESRNARKYFLICEELGIEPEAQELYEQGQLEVELEPESEVELLHKNSERGPDSKYVNFYAMGKYLDTRGFEKDVELKRKLLIDCFPGRFGKNGKQPLENLAELKVGSLFKKMMEYSEKRIHQ